MNEETKYVTHVYFAPKPTKEGFYERLTYLMKNKLSDDHYFWGASSTNSFDQNQVELFVNYGKIKPLKKPVELSTETELWLGIDGNIYKGLLQHPEIGMEVVGRMYE